MKICFKCGVSKELSEFYAHPETSDGRLGKCKECTKTDTIKNRKQKVEYYREYDNNRAKLEHRKELKVKVNTEYRTKYPERYKAVTKVNNALRDGKITKLPCARCGEEKSLAHHEDYTKPLDVIWLCQVCHKQRHTELND